MTGLRRHLVAATWTIVSLQALTIGTSVARACGEQKHRHAGVDAPDCPMHHGMQTDVAASEHHAHHANTGNPDDARWSCRCASDTTPIYLGQMATLTLSASHSPVVRGTTHEMVSEPMVLDLRSSPPSPPPP